MLATAPHVELPAQGAREKHPEGAFFGEGKWEAEGRLGKVSTPYRWRAGCWELVPYLLSEDGPLPFRFLSGVPKHAMLCCDERGIHNHVFFFKGEKILWDCIRPSFHHCIWHCDGWMDEWMDELLFSFLKHCAY